MSRPSRMQATLLGLTAVVLAAQGCGSRQARAAHAEEDPQAAVEEDLDEPGEDESDGRPPTLPEQLAINRLSRIAEQVRKLHFRQRVEVSIQRRAQIVRYLTSKLEAEDIEKAQVIYTALGLLPAGTDVRELMQRVLGEQVVGYYDHETDRLVIREDVMEDLGQSRQSGGPAESRVTIVHELVHALQDQHLGLGVTLEEDRDTDPESAYHAVVEGDATLAMIGYLAEQSGGRIEWLTRNPEALTQLLAHAPPVSDEELATAPAILRVTLISPYLDGLVFSARLHGQGGWSAVNAAHRRPPVSTEQILHPERYLSGELPDAVAIPELPGFESRGYSLLEEDTLGELEMRVYLGQLREDGVNADAASGWSGDRLKVFRGPDGTVAVVWFTAWDSVADAEEAAQAARTIARAAGPNAGHLVDRAGRAVLIVRGLERPLQHTVSRAFARFAIGLPDSPPHRELGPGPRR